MPCPMLLGRSLDNPDVIAATVVGDGEAETGPLAGGWFSNVFINPVNDELYYRFFI